MFDIITILTYDYAPQMQEVRLQADGISIRLIPYQKVILKHKAKKQSLIELKKR